MEEYIKYAPIIVVIIAFCISYNVFITPSKLNKILEDKEASCDKECEKKYVTKEQLQIERKDLIEEVRKEFLQIKIFEEFERRIDDNFRTIDRRFSDSSKRFDKIDENLEHIKDILINKK